MSAEEGINPVLVDAVIGLEKVKEDDSQPMADIDLAIKAVNAIGVRLRDGISKPEQACEDLFDTYFAFQASARETDAAHILRVVGDDLGIECEVNIDLGWELYQRAHERVERGQAIGYSVLRLKGLLQ